MTNQFKLLSPTGLIFSSLTLFSSLICADEIEKVEVVEVVGQRNQALTTPTLATEKLMAVAGIDGDPLAAVFSLPGVVYAGGDDGGEPAIRGSSPNDNAFYVDMMPTDYIFHLFGDSIFNKNLLRNIELDAAAFGSQYGNATGGVFDVKLRDPKAQPLKVKLNASLLKTGIMVEGETFNQQAFYFSYRRSLIHLFLAEGDEEDGLTIFDAPVSDDYQGKYQWLIGNNHKLTFTLNGASDSGGINISEASEEGRIDPDFIGDLSIDARFDSQGVQWEWFPHQDDSYTVSFNHVLSKSAAKYGAGQFESNEDNEFNLRFLAQTTRFDQHKLSFGLDMQSHDFSYSFDAIPYFCTDHSVDCDEQKGERIQGDDNIKANIYGLYANDVWQLTSRLSMELGVRADHDDYTQKTFVHPRASLTWYAHPQVSLFTKAGTYSRFPDVGAALPMLGNPKIQPYEAKHVSAGATWQITDHWHTKAEVYFKDLSQLARAVDIDLADADLRYTNDLSGTAKGVEWLIEKELSNNWYGWLSASWSKSERTDDITQITTEYYLDTPWIVNAVANYKINERWDIGLRFSARSGAKYTPIIGIKPNPDFPDNYLAEYGDLNSKTLPTYSRLDIQARYQYQIFGNEAALTFALINALGNENVSGYYFKPDGQETPNNFEIASEEGIGIFPSIGFELTF
jgi:outer membrane receptor protein involved in Fe transport